MYLKNFYDIIFKDISYTICINLFILLLNYCSMVSIGTMFMTMSACFLIVLQMLLDSRSLKNNVSYSTNELDENQFFLMFGAIIFSFGIASTISTIQNEKYKRYEFSRSILFSFTGERMDTYFSLSLYTLSIYFKYC